MPQENSYKIKSFANFVIIFSLCFVPDLRSLPDVAMTGNCTRECSEFGHSDSCWMPSPNRNSKISKSASKLSTFVPYQEREPQEQLMANGSPKPMGEELGGGGGGGATNKMPSIRFMAPYTSAYSAGGEGAKECTMEEIPLSQTAATTPSSQGSKREIYL